MSYRFDRQRVHNEISPYHFGFMLHRVAPALGNRVQFFLANPTSSPYSYLLALSIIRVATIVTAPSPQYFVGEGDLPDDSQANALWPHDTGYVGLPRVKVFSRDALEAALVTGRRQLNVRSYGNMFSTTFPSTTHAVIRPGTWWSWSPPQGTGEVAIEGTMTELRDASPRAFDSTDEPHTREPFRSSRDW